MSQKSVHLYDFERTARDGPRVLCGRDTRDVTWVGRASEAGGRPICKGCVKAGKRQDWETRRHGGTW